MNNKKHKLGIRAIHQKNIQAAILQAKRNNFDKKKWAALKKLESVLNSPY